MLRIFMIVLVSTMFFAQSYSIEDVEFTSRDDKLLGSIVFPINQKIQAAVVFVHGSGKQTRPTYWAKQFADAGIAALVYDKRGVGKSAGEYEWKQSVSEKNIRLLADDAKAALKKLSSHSKLKNIKLGFAGISQAGWIIPIAAENNQLAEFMLIWSGPVCKVSEEDIFSRFTRDKDFKQVPSYQTALEARTEEYIWPDFLGKDSDPSDQLINIDIPGLWIFGANDGSVPVDLSIERLEKLRKKGHNYNYVLFSGLGHNNMTETFSTATDWLMRINH